MADNPESENTTPEGSAPESPTESARQQAGSGNRSAAEQLADPAQPQNGDDNGIDTEVDQILKADAPSWRWILAAFAILAAGTYASYWVWRGVNPTDFMPSSNYAVYAGLFIMALAIERVLEPFSGLFAPTTKKKKATATIDAAKAKRALATGDANRKEAQKKAVLAQKEFHRSQSTRAVLMWATASVLAMLVCAALGIFLLRSVETPSPTGGTSTSASTQSSKTAPTGPSPAPDPIRWLDLLVTGLVVGAGTKPIHDLISQIQTSSGSSKANSSATTTTS
jgi:hypothetical protein